MQIRDELAADRDAVHDVHRLAFGSHGEVVAALVRALRDDDPEALSLVAEENGEIVGHVLFTTSLLDAPRRLVTVQVLSPLAVTPDRQRRGIGGALVRHGLRLLDQRGVPAVFLEETPGTTPASASPPPASWAFADHRCASRRPPSRWPGFPGTSPG
ncbi:hypothetical protein GCM10029963_61370 [Micromonospora andamanensis]